MGDLNDGAAAYKQHEQLLAQANALNKTAVFDALAAAGISSVTVTFNGEGDSGQIEDITADAGEKKISLPDVEVVKHYISSISGNLEPSNVTLRDAIEELCFEFLSQEHGGWENNDGGQGDFTFHVEDRRIELDFTEYFTESHQHSHTF